METKETGKKAKECTKTKDGNERSCTNSHHIEHPSFTLKLSRYYVEGDRLVCFLYFFSQ